MRFIISMAIILVLLVVLIAFWANRRRGGRGFEPPERGNEGDTKGPTNFPQPGSRT